MKNKFFLSSISGGSQIILNSFLMIITIPIFIRKMGIEQYSIFSLLMIIGNLNVFLNLGLNSSLVKYLAEQGKSRQSNSDITSGFLLLLFIIIPLTILVVYFNDFIIINILGLNNLSFENFIEVKFFFNYLIFANILIIIGQVFTAIIDALQKVYLTNISQSLYNVIFWVSILINIYTNGTFEEIGRGIFVAALFWLILVVVLSRKEWGSIFYFGSIIILINSTKKHISYGGKLYISGAMSFFYEPLSKILINHFIGLNEVGFFDIAIRIKNQIWNFLGRLIYPLFPLISILKDKIKLENTISTTLKLLLWIVTPLIVISTFVTKPIIGVWIGENEIPISISIQFLLTGYLLAVIVIPIYFFLMAKGHPQKTIWMQTLNMVVNILTFFILLPKIGYYAIVGSNFLAIVTTTILSLYYKHKLISPIFPINPKMIIKYFIYLISLLTISVSIILFNQSTLITLILIIMCNTCVAVFLFREFKVFSKIELSNFNLENTVINKILRKFLI